MNSVKRTDSDGVTNVRPDQLSSAQVWKSGILVRILRRRRLDRLYLAAKLVSWVAVWFVVIVLYLFYLSGELGVYISAALIILTSEGFFTAAGSFLQSESQLPETYDKAARTIIASVASSATPPLRQDVEANVTFVTQKLRFDFDQMGSVRKLVTLLRKCWGLDGYCNMLASKCASSLSRFPQAVVDRPAGNAVSNH